MSRIRAVRYLLCFILLFAMLGGLMVVPVLAVQENAGSPVVLPPNQEEPPAEDEEVFEEVVNLKTDFPIMSGNSGDSFEFEIEVMWMGNERRRFDLSATAPPGWKTTLFTHYGRYPEVKIAAMELSPRKFFGNEVKAVLEPVSGNLPEPGDYTITFEAASGDIRQTIELTARVSAKYDFTMRTPTLRLNADVTAGDENYLTVLLVNSSSAPVESISLTSSKPEGWRITYEPDKIDSMGAGTTREVDVIIIPPQETIAGDWPVTLQARSEQATDGLQLRVTVLTPTIWGVVGILIVVVVVAGVGVLFWRLGRR